MQTFRKPHFEQVPVAMVKQIAKEEPLDEVIADDNTTRPGPDGAQENEWRKVAEEIVLEKDAAKVMLLAERLNRALELRQGGSKMPPAKA